MHNLPRMLLLRQSTHLAHPIDFQFGLALLKKKIYRQLLATVVRTIPIPQFSRLTASLTVDSNDLSARSFFLPRFTLFKRAVLSVCGNAICTHCTQNNCKHLNIYLVYAQFTM